MQNEIPCSRSVSRSPKWCTCSLFKILRIRHSLRIRKIFNLLITIWHESPRAPTELAQALRSLLHTRVSEEDFLFSLFQVLENSVRFESREMRRRLFAWKNTFGACSLIAEIYTAPSNFLINVLVSETGLTLTGIRIYFPALQQNSMNRKEKERKSLYSFKGPACSSLLDRVT